MFLYEFTSTITNQVVQISICSVSWAVFVFWKGWKIQKNVHKAYKKRISTFSCWGTKIIFFGLLSEYNLYETILLTNEIFKCFSLFYTKILDARIQKGIIYIVNIQMYSKFNITTVLSSEFNEFYATLKKNFIRIWKKHCTFENFTRFNNESFNFTLYRMILIKCYMFCDTLSKLISESLVFEMRSFLQVRDS